VQDAPYGEKHPRSGLSLLKGQCRVTVFRGPLYGLCTNKKGWIEFEEVSNLTKVDAIRCTHSTLARSTSFD